MKSRLVIAGLALMVGLVAFGLDQEETFLAGYSTTAQLRTTAALDLYVDPGGNDNSACTSAAAPCATIEGACGKIPNDVCHLVTVTVDAGSYAGGCHLIGKRQCAGSSWSAPGQVVIRGVLSTYAPADGGTGAGTLSSVSNGSNCTESVFTDSAAAWNTNELQGKLFDISSGTGAATGYTWPIVSNTATAVTIAGIPITNPTAGSGYIIKERATIITAALSDTIVSSGPPIPAKTARKAAFVVSNGQPYQDESSTIPFISIERLKFSYATDVGVWGNGPVALKENEFTSSVIGFRGLPGQTHVALERNTLNGTGTFVVLGNTAYGSLPSAIQAYSNVGINSGTFISTGTAGQVWTKFNTLTQTGSAAAAIRVAAVLDGVSQCDNFTGFASCFSTPTGLTLVSGPVQMSFNGLVCDDNSRGTYQFSLAGGYAHISIDENAGSTGTSTITSSSHIAALNLGARLTLGSTSTTFSGAGTDFSFTGTPSSVTLAALRARIPKVAMDPFGSIVSEAGGTAPLWDPALVHGSTPKAIESGTSAFVAGVRAITFGTAFTAAPDCTCTTSSATVPCSISTPASTTAVTFSGTTTDAFSYSCTGAR